MTHNGDVVESATSGRGSRTVLVTLVGAVVRKLGNWMPIAGAVELLQEAGRDSSSVRTAVFRLKNRGWLVPETRNGMRGYALTPMALEELAAGDAMIWHARQPAELAAGWCVVSFSVPERARAQRHQLRSHLAALGFGNIGKAIWLAPARMRAPAEKAIEQLGMTKHCVIFVGADYVGGQDLSQLVHGSWDLAAINQRYLSYLATHAPVADELAASAQIEGRDAFVAYLEAVDSWRKLPFRDPGLPKELLSPDWAAPEAAALFEQLVGQLEGRALAHAATYWSPDRIGSKRS